MNNTFRSNSGELPAKQMASKGLSQGLTIPDHELVRCIGQGSYGEVWLARNNIGTYRAVKVLRRVSFTDARPFERELSGLRSFEPISRSHEGFIDILQVGINEELGYYYYVMELGDDEELQQQVLPDRYIPKTLARELFRRGKLPFQECLKLGVGLSDALARLHAHGLVHRDIKPSNILFVGGVPKLADIGLVSTVDHARSYVGTEGFIPPEGPGTPQADIYSLGKLLYEAFTGKDRQEFPELPLGFDEGEGGKDFLELNDVILRACQNDTAKRYASAEFLHTDLQLLTAGKSVRRLRLLERRFSSLKRAAGIAGAAAVLAGLLLYPVYVHWRDAVANRQRQVGANLAYGAQAVETGDRAGALPYFAEALRLDHGNPDRAMQHRLRFGSTLAQSPRLVQMWCATQQIVEVGLQRDGSRILAVERFGQAQVFDIATAQPVSAPFGQKSFLWRGDLSPAGDRAVLGGEDQTARVWRIEDGAELLRLEHPDKVLSAKFSPDGRRIVTGCRDNLGRVWDARTGQVEFVLPGHTDALLWAAFSPDGQRIVTTGRDGTARLWDATDGHSLGPPLHHGNWIYSAAFGPRSELVTAGYDHQARLWNLETSQEILPPLPHPDGVKSVEFSPDGRLILTACLDGTARIWSRRTHLPWPQVPLLRHGGRLTHACFSPDGTRVITSTADGTIRVWDLCGTAGSQAPFRGKFSADKTRYAVQRNDGFEVRDSFSGQTALSLVRPVSADADALLSPDGRLLLTWEHATTPEDPALQTQLWDSTSGQLLARGLSLTNAPLAFVLTGARKYLVIASTNEVLACTFQEGFSIAWTKPFHASLVKGLAANDARGTVGLWTANEFYCWDGATGGELFAPVEHQYPIKHLAFSPNGNWIITCCADNSFDTGSAQVWDSSTGRQVGAPLYHRDGIVHAAFSPDSSRVVTAGEDFTARIWDVTSGTPHGPPVWHRGQVLRASFSPDGQWVLTVAADGSARIWDAETAEPITPPLLHTHGLMDAGFLNHGKAIITLDVAGDARVFDLRFDPRPADDLRQIARLLSGEMITPPGASEVSPEPMLLTWQRLRAHYPSGFVSSPDELRAWHLSQAGESELEQDWEAAAYHLRRACAISSTDHALRQRLDLIEKRLASP